MDAPLNEAATVIPILAVADGGDNKFGVPPAGRDNAIERYARATFPACLRHFHETSAAAIDDIDAIAATPGIDGLFIGSYDLSVSVGVPGADFDNPTMSAASKYGERLTTRRELCDIFTHHPTLTVCKN